MENAKIPKTDIGPGGSSGVNPPNVTSASGETVNPGPIDNQLVILNKATLDRFLKEDNPGNLIALYTFYYYTAKWQQTNQPYCTTSYAAKGLHWRQTKVISTKKQLINMGLITDIWIRRCGKFCKSYISVNYIWKTENAETVCASQNQSLPKRGAVDGGTNALSNSNSTNALSTNKEITTTTTASSSSSSSGTKSNTRSKSKSKMASPMSTYGSSWLDILYSEWERLFLEFGGIPRDSDKGMMFGAIHRIVGQLALPEGQTNNQEEHNKVVGIMRAYFINNSGPYCPKFFSGQVKNGILLELANMPSRVSPSAESSSADPISAIQTLIDPTWELTEEHKGWLEKIAVNYRDKSEVLLALAAKGIPLRKSL